MIPHRYTFLTNKLVSLGIIEFLVVDTGKQPNFQLVIVKKVVLMKTGQLKINIAVWWVSKLRLRSCHRRVQCSAAPASLLLLPMSKMAALPPQLPCAQLTFIAFFTILSA